MHKVPTRTRFQVSVATQHFWAISKNFLQKELVTWCNLVQSSLDFQCLGISSWSLIVYCWMYPYHGLPTAMATAPPYVAAPNWPAYPRSPCRRSVKTPEKNWPKILSTGNEANWLHSLCNMICLPPSGDHVWSECWDISIAWNCISATAIGRQTNHDRPKFQHLTVLEETAGPRSFGIGCVSKLCPIRSSDRWGSELLASWWPWRFTFLSTLVYTCA